MILNKWKCCKYIKKYLIYTINKSLKIFESNEWKD